jgi:hypothetical protein
MNCARAESFKPWEMDGRYEELFTHMTRCRALHTDLRDAMSTPETLKRL